MPDPIAPNPPAEAPAALPSSVEFRPREEIRVEPANWAAGAAAVRTGLAAENLPDSDMSEALNGFRFLDDADATWTYNGSDWLTWDGTTWVTAAPPAALNLQPFRLDLVPDAPDSVPGLPAIEPAAAAEPARVVEPVPLPQPAPQPMTAPTPAPMPQPVTAPIPAPQPSPVPPAYRPTHAVPPMGMAAWPQPNPQQAPHAQLGPGLDVMVVEWLPSGWAHIVCSNQWSGWVDGRLLLPWGQPLSYPR